MPNLSPQELFDELLFLDSAFPLQERVQELNEVLKRICADFVSSDAITYTGLFSLLYAICRREKIEHHSIDGVRRYLRRVLRKEVVPTEESYIECRAEMARFIGNVYHCSVPDGLRRASKNLPTEKRDISYRKVRAVVTRPVDATTFYCLPMEQDTEWKVVGTEEIMQESCALLEVGMCVNLLDVSNMGESYTFRLLVIEPDFLLEVSSLTATVKTYGSHPFNYFLQKIAERKITPSILLGNAANQFVDDIVNERQCTERDVLYRTSIKKHFRNEMLAYVAMKDDISEDYFKAAKKQFDHIYEVIHRQFPEIGIRLDDILLEPSFICEALGLRGRMDILTLDFQKMVELKSGKADDWPASENVRPKEEHLLQMTLYAEILHRNLGLSINAIHQFLFYSRYPLLIDQRSSFKAVKEVLLLRNKIVCLERCLQRGEIETILSHLSLDVLNERKAGTPLWERWQRPNLEETLQRLQNMSALERAYFCAFFTFVEREQFLAKTTDPRADSNRGFARVWEADFSTKVASGDILYDLRIKEIKGEEAIEGLVLEIPVKEETFIANFNVGEMVQLYERDEAGANVTNRLLTRAYIQALTEEEVVLSLYVPQRNHRLFSFTRKYAIEHDATDSAFSSSYRGLYAFLSAPVARKELLLGIRMPQRLLQRQLLADYGEPINEVVLRAKQAADYFLLIGPPGTGKTNVALKAMVQEFLLEKEQGEAGGLLLMAYTNRAVDEICSMLDGIGVQTSVPLYVRIGREQTCAECYHPHLLAQLSEKCSNRREVEELLQAIPIVVGTVLTLSNHPELFKIKTFRAAIIDEASQIVETQLIGLLSAHIDGRLVLPKFILIGDHKQLPAVVMLPSEQTVVSHPDLLNIGLTDLRNSLFERLYNLLKKNGQLDFVCLLQKQGRMHADINAFVNSAFYNSQLRIVPLAHQEGRLLLPSALTPCETFVASTRMGFVDVPRPLLPTNGGKSNANEALVVAHLVKAAVKLYEEKDPAFCVDKSIGVIVPFRSQISAVRNELRRLDVRGRETITIDTVECYQGSQRDLIFFTTTVSRPHQLATLSAVQEQEECLVDRKLNVAVTRARLQLFVVGNAALLRRSVVYRQLLDACTLIEASALGFSF